MFVVLRKSVSSNLGVKTLRNRDVTRLKEYFLKDRNIPTDTHISEMDQTLNFLELRRSLQTF